MTLILGRFWQIIGLSLLGLFSSDTHQTGLGSSLTQTVEGLEVKVDFLGVVALWRYCRDIPTDWGQKELSSYDRPFFHMYLTQKFSPLHMKKVDYRTKGKSPLVTFLLCAWCLTFFSENHQKDSKSVDCFLYICPIL